MIRLDKFLCEMELGTRSQVKEMIKKGMILVDGEIMKKADYKFDESKAKVIAVSTKATSTYFKTKRTAPLSFDCDVLRLITPIFFNPFKQIIYFRCFRILQQFPFWFL